MLMCSIYKNFPDSSVGKESARRLWFNSRVRKIPWRRDSLPTPLLLGFPCGSAGKESACTVGDPGWIPGLGRSPGEGKGCPLQYSCLETSMDYHWVTKSWTRLSLHAHTHIDTSTVHLRPGIDPWVGKIPWRRERQPTPVFWPREFHGLYSPWGRKELDMAERLSVSLFKTY